VKNPLDEHLTQVIAAMQAVGIPLGFA